MLKSLFPSFKFFFPPKKSIFVNIRYMRKELFSHGINRNSNLLEIHKKKMRRDL